MKPYDWHTLTSKQKRVRMAQVQEVNQRVLGSMRARDLCTCGKPATWHGPRTGLRIFACDPCYAAHPTK